MGPSERELLSGPDCQQAYDDAHWPQCEPNPYLCEHCAIRPVLGDDIYCQQCLQNMAEVLYERSLGECFRGNEAESYNAEQQAWIQRNLK